MIYARATAFGLGLMLIAVPAYLALSSEPHRNSRLKAQACARDSISPKDCRHLEGDHIWPLCAGGSDTLDNIQLQPCDRWDFSRGIPECVAGEAYHKDLQEWDWCGLIRRGEALPEQAGAYFRNHKRCPPAVSGCW